MKFRTAVLAAALGFAFTGAASAQVISYSPRTGDVVLDTQLGYMNDYGRSNRDYFVDDVVNTYGAPRYLVNDLLTTRRWQPGDVYYACALAYQLRRPCGDVAKTYEQNRGQGWGVIAQRMGIKPGSAQFHALKGNVGKSNGKFKAHMPGVDNGPGNSGNNAKGMSNDGPGNSGKSDKGNSGNSGKSDNSGNGNSDNAKGKGNSGKGKPNGGGH